jgi:hypothetical protein
MVIVIEEGVLFNWVEILSSNMAQEIRACKEEPPDRSIVFFMSSYLLDTICSYFHLLAIFTMVGGSSLDSYLFQSNVGVDI